MRVVRRIFPILILIVLLAACGGDPEAEEPQAEIPTLAATAGQPTPTLMATPADNGQPTPPPPPTVTAVGATPEPTVPPTPSPVPPPTEIPAGTADLAPDMPAQTLLSWILAQREGGRSLDEVAADLLAAGLLYDAASNPLYANGALAFAAVDSAGGGEPYWALGLYRGQTGNGRLYEFWLVGADHLELSFPGTEFAEMPPLLLATADLSGDGLPDYLLQQSNCGAHTCFGTYWVYSHHGGVLRSRLNAGEGLAAAVAAADPRANIMPEWSDRINMSTPTITISDLTGDGIADIHFRGGIIGSVGAGIHQGFDQIWSWSGTQMLMVDFQWDYTGFRHHELYDGDFAARLGERDIAMSHYLRVMFDETLRDDYTLGGDEAAARALARQIAGFRLLQLTEMGQAEWLAYLQSEYPDQPLTDAARIYWGNWLPGEESAACAEVNRSLETQVEPLGQFAGQLGYGNPTYSGADFCWPMISLGMEAQQPAVWQEVMSTGSDLLDAVIAAMLAHDSDALGQLLHVVERPCTHDPGPGALICADDEGEGTLVPSLVVAHCEGAVIRIDPAALPDFSADMAASQGLFGMGYDERTESQVLVFGTGNPIGDLTLFVDDVGVHTIIWFGCASPATRLLQYASNGVMLAPPEPLGRPLRGW